MIKVNNEPINITMFPDNTSQVWKLPESVFTGARVLITWEFQHEGEFMHLAQLKCLLESHEVNSNLFIKYLPYARQDKVIRNNNTFAREPFVHLLNSLKFDYIEVLDPHSSIYTIKNAHPIYPKKAVEHIIALTKTDLLAYPDKGANDKYSDLYNFPYIYGEKVRDWDTGKIVFYNLIGNPKDKTVLIVDDICDGGMTFIYLAEALFKKGAKEVNLFVTHGIFSKGLQVLKNANIKQIFTYDGEVGECQNSLTYRRLYED